MLHFFYTPYHFTAGLYERYESANAEIVKYASKYLGASVTTHISNFNSSRVTDRAEDILIGHPTWDATYDSSHGKFNVVNNWVKDNALDPSESSHPNTYMFMPWIPIFLREARMPFASEQLAAARLIFAICGEFWFRKTGQLDDGSVQSRVTSKLVRLNMGCAAHLLPAKKQYRRRNRRNFLHVSHLGPAKNIPLMLQSIRGLDVNLFIASHNLRQTGPATVKFSNTIGTTERGEIHSLGAVSNNDPEFNQFVTENCDFYIHTSTYDAQATAILENCARGLVPIVTPECGFNCPHAIMLSNDPARNREIIQAAIQMPDEEYEHRSRGVRAFILEHHSWKRIYSRVWQVIQADQTGMPFDPAN